MSPECRRKGQRAKGQVLVLGAVFAILFILVAAALVDIYHLEEARNWGYRAAQQAAMAGASVGRDWSSFQPTPDPVVPTPTMRPDNCIPPGTIRLDENASRNAATAMLNREFAGRNLSPVPAVIVVHANPGGGTTSNFPPRPVRLGYPVSDWTTDDPAVGVYFTFRVFTFFMSFIGRPYVDISVFAAAEVAQPASCPPLP